jgi:hypothetical protein
MMPHLRAFRFAILSMLCASAAAAQAGDPRAVQPERPTVATHAGTVAPAYVEIETGVEADRSAGGARALLTPTTLKVGVSRRMQLNVTGQWMRLSGGGAPTRTGGGDVTVGLKWRLAENAPVLARFAVLPQVKLPTGSAEDGTGTSTLDFGLLLISSRQVGPVAIDLNAGYTTRVGDDPNVAPRDATVWTASFGFPVAGPLGMVAEAFGYPGTSGPAGSAPTVAVLTGPTLLVRRWLAIDAGVIRRIDGPQPNALYAGLVYNVGRLPVARRVSPPPW